MKGNLATIPIVPRKRFQSEIRNDVEDEILEENIALKKRVRNLRCSINNKAAKLSQVDLLRKRIRELTSYTDELEERVDLFREFLGKFANGLGAVECTRCKSVKDLSNFDLSLYKKTKHEGDFEYRFLPYCRECRATSETSYAFTVHKCQLSRHEQDMMEEEKD